MKKKDAGDGPNITFHNPNSDEDTVKYLTRIIAVTLADQAVRGLPLPNRGLPDKTPVKKSERER